MPTERTDHPRLRSISPVLPKVMVMFLIFIHSGMCNLTPIYTGVTIKPCFRCTRLMIDFVVPTTAYRSHRGFRTRLPCPRRCPFFCSMHPLIQRRTYMGSLQQAFTYALCFYNSPIEPDCFAHVGGITIITCLPAYQLYWSMPVTEPTLTTYGHACITDIGSSMSNMAFHWHSLSVLST